MKRLLMGAAGLAALAGCMTGEDDRAAIGEGVDVSTSSAEIRDSAGRVVGSATATQSGDSIRVRVDGTNIPQGVHGVHLHMTGRCDAPAFTSAGDHWNPTGQRHGKDNPQGMHMGDLPNLLIGTDGRGTLEYTIPAASVMRGERPLIDGDGAAVVVHANADDYRTDPSGNSGGRIACGVLVPLQGNWSQAQPPGRPGAANG